MTAQPTFLVLARHRYTLLWDRRDCPRRARHGTPQEAASAIRWMPHDPNNPRANVYDCACGFYHLGHAKVRLIVGEVTRDRSRGKAGS